VHRSRLPLLAIVTAIAACSTHKEPDGAKALSRDSTLAARFDGSENTDQKTDKLPYPDACGAVTIPDQPSDADKAQAAGLSRQAYDAEVLGDARQASSLLRRASALDWTDKTAAYHLGRISETVGDPAAAIAAYCRYLALAPTIAEGAEVRQRVASLSRSQSQTRVAAGSVVDGSTARSQSAASTAREAHAKPVTKPSAIARDDDALPPRAASIERGKRSVNAATDGVAGLPSQSKPTAAQPKVERSADSVVANGDGVAMPRPGSTVDQSPPMAQPTAPPTNPRTTSRVQTAGIGAVVGAVIGGVAGRSAKSAAIGAAAGGILGAVVPRGTRSTSRGG
jgi:hypothetical protein